MEIGICEFSFFGLFHWGVHVGNSMPVDSSIKDILYSLWWLRYNSRAGCCCSALPCHRKHKGSRGTRKCDGLFSARVILIDVLRAGFLALRVFSRTLYISSLIFRMPVFIPFYLTVGSANLARTRNPPSSITTTHISLSMFTLFPRPAFKTYASDEFNYIVKYWNYFQM